MPPIKTEMVEHIRDYPHGTFRLYTGETTVESAIEKFRVMYEFDPMCVYYTERTTVKGKKVYTVRCYTFVEVS